MYNLDWLEWVHIRNTIRKKLREQGIVRRGMITLHRSTQMPNGKWIKHHWQGGQRELDDVVQDACVFAYCGICNDVIDGNDPPRIGLHIYRAVRDAMTGHTACWDFEYDSSFVSDLPEYPVWTRLCPQHQYRSGHDIADDGPDRRSIDRNYCACCNWSGIVYDDRYSTNKKQ